MGKIAPYTQIVGDKAREEFWIVITQDCSWRAGLLLLLGTEKVLVSI